MTWATAGPPDCAVQHSPGPPSAFRAPLARERDANAARGRKQADEKVIFKILHTARTAVSLPMDYIAPRVSGSGQNLPPLFVDGTEQPRQRRAGRRVTVRRE